MSEDNPPAATADAPSPDNSETAADSPAIRQPISDDAPAGQRVRYDEDFRALKAQIDAIGAAGEEVHYDRVVELARTILAEKSKDLQTAAFLVLGEARLRGAEGLAAGMRVLRVMVDQYWESLYPAPDRARGRGNALQFVADRVPDWLKETSFEAEDRGALEQALADLEALQSFTLDALGEHAPALSGLTNDLSAALDTLPEPPADASPASPTQADGGQQQAEDGGEPTAEETGGPEEETAAPSASALTSASDADQVVRSAAQFYRDDDLTAPRAYRLLRSVRWDPLRTLPPHDDGITRFDPPREQRRTYLQGLLEDDDHETLVQEAEASFQSGPFHVWLDLQRLVASALEALGAAYADAHEAVVRETAGLVRRLPALETLSFSDGTPFATAMTREWIESQVCPQPATEESGEAGPDGGGDDSLQEHVDDAQRALTGGALDDALTIMVEAASAEEPKKRTFRRRLYMAGFCLTAGELSVARALLDQIHAAVQEHALDGWAPALVLDACTRRMECYDQLAEGAAPEEATSLRDVADAAFERICELDPSRAAVLRDQRPSQE